MLELMIFIWCIGTLINIGLFIDFSDDITPILGTIVISALVWPLLMGFGLRND